MVWFIFVIVFIIIALIALLVLYIANKVFLLMEKERKKADMEDEVYKEAQRIIKEKKRKEE